MHLTECKNPIDLLEVKNLLGFCILTLCNIFKMLITMQSLYHLCFKPQFSKSYHISPQTSNNNNMVVVVFSELPNLIDCWMDWFITPRTNKFYFQCWVFVFFLFRFLTVLPTWTASLKKKKTDPQTCHRDLCRLYWFTVRTLKQVLDGVGLFLKRK